MDEDSHEKEYIFEENKDETSDEKEGGIKRIRKKIKRVRRFRQRTYDLRIKRHDSFQQNIF